MNDIKTAISKSVKELFGENVAVELTRPDAQFGDFSSNIALQLAKKLGKNPREIADELVQRLAVDEKIEKVEVAGPGFINITLTNSTLV